MAKRQVSVSFVTSGFGRAKWVKSPRSANRSGFNLDPPLIIAYIDCNDCTDEGMGSITIRNLDDSLKRKLRIRAAQHGRSMEEEARQILRAGLTEKAPAPTNLYDAIRRDIAPLGGVDLEIPPRGPMREPPRFDE